MHDRAVETHARLQRDVAAADSAAPAAGSIESTAHGATTEPEAEAEDLARRMLDAIACPGGGTIRGDEEHATGAAAAEAAHGADDEDGPTDDEIRARAYEIWLERDKAPGDPVADWLQAERELRERRRGS